MGTDLSDTQDVYHLSNLPKNQLWFWIGQNLEPNTPFFNMPMALTINGIVEPERFNRAFQEVVNRSDSLRTIIQNINGIPQRKVLDLLPYRVDYLDFSSNLNPESDFNDWAEQRCKTLFDLSKIMFDAVLVKISSKKTIWYWCQHHLICDGWSTALVYKYVSEFYEKSFSQDITSMPSFPLFETYVEKEKLYRKSEQHMASKRYWEDVLSSPLDTLNFYGKTAREHGVNKAVRITRDLGKERTEALKQLSQTSPFRSLSSHLTIFQIISTCLLTYLYRVTGNKELALGSLYHNRATKECKETIGFFMETAPLRVRAEPDDTFESLYLKTRKSSNEVMRHYRYAPGNPINNRAYDVAINYNNASYPPFSGMPMSLHWLHTGAWYSHEPLAIQIHDFDKTGSFTAAFDFNIGVFDEETRERAICHFLNCIDAMLASPSASINEFEIVTAEEKKLLDGPLLERGRLDVANIPLHQLIENQAKKLSSKIAVYNSQTSYSYADLLEKSEALAIYLLSLGAKQNTPIGLCMNKHPDMIVAMLGILRAGCGYLPIDPKYPDERKKHMISDSGINLVLTRSDCSESLQKYQVKTILLDNDWPSTRNLTKDLILPAVDTNQLAYVIYTSGSTGKSKGVMIEHRSIVNYVSAAIEAFDLNENDRVLQFSSISFDTACEEIFPALSIGASLFLVTDEMQGSVKNFVEGCHGNQISFLDLPTAFWHQLTKTLINEKKKLPNSIKKVVIGGERAQPKIVDNWLNHFADIRLINTYGPTEVTIVSTYCDLDKQSLRANQEVPIGKPVMNLQAYVLDAYMNKVPIGAIGELHMGGAGLARGYHNRAQLTEEKFVPNPFSKTDNDKLYKTGDLVRFRRDGLLEYKDRIDDQLKIRGYRIELGEVEAQLMSIRDVDQGFINVTTDKSIEKQLIAYYVTKTGSILEDEEVKAQLKTKLPDYMIPRFFIKLESLPTNSNGKIDKLALPAPDIESTPVARKIIPAESPMQKSIAKIWGTLPNIEQVGLYDNFFDIGGDSLLMMQAISEMEIALGISVTPRMLVSLNLAQLAAEFETVGSQSVSSNMVTNDQHLMTFWVNSNGNELFTSRLSSNNSPNTMVQKSVVIMLYPFGHEYLRAFRCFRIIAQKLTELGNTVYRFDYAGTGDSALPHSEVDLKTWIDNTNDIIEIAKTENSVEKVSLVGLRIGANIAESISSQRSDIEQLVLWDPIVDGCNVSQCLNKMHASMLVDEDRFCMKRKLNECEPNELLGFNYSEDFLSQLNRLKFSWKKQSSEAFPIKREKFTTIFSNKDAEAAFKEQNSNVQEINTVETFASTIQWDVLSQLETSIAPADIISFISARFKQ